ncbi:MAG: pyridoxal phosphate-dependent aminotransferase [Polyangiaceae bacterium]
MFSLRSACPRDENAIFEAKRAILADGRSLLDLTPSNPTAVGLEPFTELPELLSPRGVERYRPDPFGLLEAREALAVRWSHVGTRISPTQIMLTASTSEAYGVLFKLLCDPGDEVLIPEPSYPLFEHLARLEHVQLVPYRHRYDGAWYLDIDSVRARRTPRTRAILLVSPNNPTGSVVSRSELNALAELGLPLVSDEVFGRYLFGDAKTRFHSALEAPEALVFVLDGLSKSMGLPQCKLGWTTVSGPRELVDEALCRLEIICDSYLSVATPVQLALPALLRHESARHTVIQRRLETNLAHLLASTRDTAVSPLSLDGGWSAVLRVPAVRSETEWVLGLMESHGVVVQPGWFFDFEREAFLVVSLLTEPDIFARGIASILADTSALG